jgi:hypothetical protein
MSAPDSILRLVDLFESQARRELIDPFFEALGWDLFN